MAKIKVTYADEFIDQINKIANNEEKIIKRSLEEAAEHAIPIFRSELKSAIGSGIKYKGRSTGELLSSLGTSDVKYSDKSDSYNIKLGFNEPRRKQTISKGKRSYYRTTNAMIANVLEYGKRTINQPPKKFIKKTISKIKKQSQDIINEVFKREVENMK